MSGLATGLPHYMEAGSLPCALRICHRHAKQMTPWKAAFESPGPTTPTRTDSGRNRTTGAFS